MTKCRERAKMSVWWPGISSDIRKTVVNCELCIAHKPKQRHEPLITTPLPEGPWQRVAADLCEIDRRNYLVVVDYYSRYIEMVYLSSITSLQVVNHLKSMFSRWGVPLEFISDTVLPGPGQRHSGTEEQDAPAGPPDWTPAAARRKSSSTS